MAFPATLSMILDAFPERAERARAIGLWGAIAGVAIATGPIVGGWLLSQFAWPSIFIAMVPIAYATIACAVAFLPNRPGTADDPLDVAGLVTSALAMARSSTPSSKRRPTAGPAPHPSRIRGGRRLNRPLRSP